jgi:adenine deaminase
LRQRGTAHLSSNEQMRILPALTALIGALAAVCRGSTSGQVSPTTTFMIRDVRVFDGDRTIERTNVVVRDGIIATVGEESIEPGMGAVRDGRGRTLLPGLIDGHVHVRMMPRAPSSRH